MAEPDSDTPVGQWVAQLPHTSRVFESLQIDYCCGGDQSLGQACSERQLDTQDVLEQLRAAVQADATQLMEDWTSASLADLCSHIEQTHHAYLRSELPRLTELIAKVVAAHGESHSELAELQQVFASLRGELEPHMMKEEQVLFPAIRQLEQSEATPAFPFGTIANPIRMMEHEHDNVGGALRRIRHLTSEFRAPDDACNAYRAMLDGLLEMEQNLHEHVHKENNILFPKAQELEAAS